MDAASAMFLQRGRGAGEALVGREVLVCWDDGVWYDAVVVCFYPTEDEYKLVYRADDGIEICKLRDRRWVLAPKKRPTSSRPVLDGCLIEFEYPGDGQRYKAMVYDYSHNGERLKIAYIDEHSTDNIRGGGWDFLTSSPCELVDVELAPERAQTARRDPDLKREEEPADRGRADRARSARLPVVPPVQKRRATKAGRRPSRRRV